jgi:NAD(P)-dependent dehydrogenase (short-subunit alcohol dehydrogenase family)
MGCVVVTGASRGIGLEFCRQYNQQGREVYAACRTISDELQELQNRGVKVVTDVDVATEKGVEVLQNALVGQTIDILVNNAGIFGNNQLGEINYADIERQFLTNALAPVRLTEALLPQLVKNSKVAMITSRMGSVTDNSSGAYYGYRMSKAALNAAGVSLARDLHPRGIAVALLHPGFVQTQMVGFAGDISPAVAAERLIARIEQLTLDNSGSFWHSNGEELPW